MSDPNESVAELYRKQTARLFEDVPEGARATALHDEIRSRYRNLAVWLADVVPPCPELWHAVQDLHQTMLLCDAAVAANWRNLAPSELKGMPVR